MNLATRIERPRREAGALTRRRLLEVGRRAFARRGHAGTNLRDDILLPAGISVGSFYHQFHDKTDLFLEILREHSESFLERVHRAHRIPEIEAVSPGDVARESFATCFRIAEENEDIFHIMLRERESDDARVRAYLQDNRQHWIASLAADYRRLLGSADERVTELAAEFISSLTLTTLVAYLELSAEKRAARRDALVEGLVHFTAGGLAGLLAMPVPERAAREAKTTRTARAAPNRRPTGRVRKGRS